MVFPAKNSNSFLPQTSTQFSMGGRLNLVGGDAQSRWGDAQSRWGDASTPSPLQFKYWLGPILFLIYINDLSNCSNFKTTLYANDSVLTLSHKNINCLPTMLNFELPKINAWLKSNRLSLNVNKTNFLFFTKTKEKIFSQINDCKIKQANFVKYLGVFLDDNLTWKKHI